MLGKCGAERYAKTACVREEVHALVLVLKRSLLGLLALVLLLLAWLVIPPQVQLRAVRPPLPELDALLALRSDEGPVSVHYLNSSSQRAPGRSLAHPAYLLRWPDGRGFLIDAGMDREAAREFGKLLETMWGAEPAAFHGSVFDQLGNARTRLAGMGFTHLHIDHTQGAAAFCSGSSAPTVFQTRAQRERQNRNTQEGAAIVAQCPQSPALDGRQLTAVPGFPGLAVFTAAGHTPGSTLFVAALPERWLVFSGDITNSKGALLANAPKAWWYSYLAVPEDTARTAALRPYLAGLDADLRFAVIVAHDLDDARLSVPEYQGW